MHSLLFQALSPAGQSARLTILIFHRVLPAPDPIFPGEVDVAQFDAICGWIRGWHHVLALDDAVRRLAEGRLPSRALAITFDDGYADNHDLALPILQRHGLTATFFIATGFLDGGRMWNDTVVESIRRTSAAQLDFSGLGLPGVGMFATDNWEAKRRAIETVLGQAKYLETQQRLDLVGRLARKVGARLPDDLMMSSDQVRALHRAGMGIGAHTVNHPILANMDDAGALAELRQGRASLQALTQSAVPLLAYPNGRPERDYSAHTVRLARQVGFSAAVSTAPGAAMQHTDLFQLPRFTPWDRQRLKFGLRLLRNLRQPLLTST